MHLPAGSIVTSTSVQSTIIRHSSTVKADIHTHIHTRILLAVLGLTALGGAAMLGGVIAVGVATLAGVGIAKLSKR